MTILSRPSVLRLIEQGQLVIDPFDPARLSAVGSYTLAIGEYAEWPAGPYGSAVRSDRPVTSAALYRLGQAGDRLADVLLPGRFVLLRTAERLKLPSRVFGWLSTRPKLAQIGLDLLQSSFLVPPGTDQQLILETSNRGPYRVQLVPGSRAVKIVFLRSD